MLVGYYLLKVHTTIWSAWRPAPPPPILVYPTRMAPAELPDIG